MKIKIIFCLAVFLGLCIKGQAQCLTTNLTIFVTSGNPTGSNVTYIVQSGQIAKIVYAAVNGNSTLSVNLSNNLYTNAPIILLALTNNLTSGLPIIVGPAIISLNRNGNPNTNNSGICTIEVSTPNIASNSSFVPSTAVVIPADSGGSVNIILESSPDLINWYPSLPGTYGANYTNRFFRVRAQLAP